MTSAAVRAVRAAAGEVELLREYIRQATGRYRRVMAQWRRQRSDVAKAARELVRVDLQDARTGLRAALVTLKRARLHKRLNESWGALATDVGLCHRATVGDWTQLGRTAQGRGGMFGYQVCAGAVRCPICAAKIAGARAHEIGQGLSALHAMGGFAFFLTQTAAHDRDTDPVWMTDALLRACSTFWADTSVKESLRAIGYVGSIKSLEATDGTTGPHPHRHNVVCLARRPSPAEIERFRDVAARAWCAATSAEGLFADMDHGTNVSHRLDVEECDAERIAYYMTKLGLESAMVATKRGKAGRMTLGQLLNAAHHGSRWASHRWMLWQVALRGRSLVKWSRDLRDALGLGEEMTDEEAAREPAPSERTNLFSVSRADARIIQGRRGVHDFDLRPWIVECLDVHTVDGLAELRGIAAALGITLHDPGGGGIGYAGELYGGDATPGGFDNVVTLTAAEKAERARKRRSDVDPSEDHFALARTYVRHLSPLRMVSELTHAETR